MNSFIYGWNDIRAMLANFSLAWLLGWQEIRLKYRRSKIGPFWITISTGVMISMIAIIFGQALKTPIDEYLPYVASGIIFWGFISTSVNEGCVAFNGSSSMIRQLDIPLSLYPTKVILKNVVILCHNLLLLPIVFLVAEKPLTWFIILIVPAFFLVLMNVFWISLVLGVLCTRFRDLPPIIGSVVQVLFYLTPIIWMPEALNAKVSKVIVECNPLYYVLELLRAPILGYCPPVQIWLVVLLFSVLGFVLASVFFGKFKDRLAYWV